MRFGVMKFIVAGAMEAAARCGAELSFSVVTNLWFMDEEKFRFLTGNRITVCTSLDGPEKLHDINRPCRSGGSYAKTAYWLARLSELARLRGLEAPNAICTVTRASLPYAREITDEYIKLGIKRLQFGPVDPLGRAAKNWEKIGYGPDEFALFYRQALEYILELNARGVAAYEKGALAFVKQLSGWVRPRYQNLDVLYRMAYNWDGGIYGSDEARMLANGGDEFFRLGDVFSDDFRGILRKPMTRFLIYSALSPMNQPLCARCPYSLYCRIPPVYSYVFQKNPAGNMAVNPRCAMYRKIYGFLSELAAAPVCAKIFSNWNEKYD